ncbi:zinc finger CCCH domain-containing protein 3 isoform X2 [Tenrec ecaudatus]|uniref:zinc finger CCCH domain-containing protein 3 isoform X2 n=1 Tax=Tenrec ecaudatus TaxID=94439 RepID=UPI003F5A5084
MTLRGPGWASWSPEMEEKEQLRRQIRLLQGLIDDYKNLHGSALARGPPMPTTRWQPPVYHCGRSFSVRYPRPSRRGFAPPQGPEWRKKYSLVNRPPGSMDLPGDGTAQPALRAGPSVVSSPQPCVLQRQVRLSPGQNMVIRVTPPARPGLAIVVGAQQGLLEEREGTPWSDQGPQEGEGEPTGTKLQPSRAGRVKDRGSGGGIAKESLLVCQKEPGKPRAVRSVSRVSRSPPGPRRTVSEGAIAVKARAPPAQSPRSAGVPGRKMGLHPVASCAAQLLVDSRADAGHPDQPSPLVAGPAGATPGPRQAPEASQFPSCRTSRFRKNNYKWVATAAKNPRAVRRTLNPRVAADNSTRAPVGGVVRLVKPQLKAEPDAKTRKATPSPMAGSKYKWKAAASPSAAVPFHWQPEAGSRDRPAPLSPVLSPSFPEDSAAAAAAAGAGPSGSEPLFGEPSLSGYKVQSRTKIIRRRSGASLPGDKKSSPPATSAATKSRFSLRRRPPPRGKSSPAALKRMPNRGLLQVSRHRLCRLPAARTPAPTKEACLHPLRTPPTSKVIKTRYRIIKKSLASLPSPQPFSQALPAWRARRLSPRSLVLNRLRPASAGAGKAPPSTPQWRNRCIGGVLYRVSANKLSRTSGLRAGRWEPASTSGRSLARAVQRSLAILRQARQKRREPRAEYCTYYNRFGRCSRGERCPYIHDPEKVAVCTRFLRGTCKKTDGTCPFSHQVSKDKMPVCSYFLKGICSNSSCPYSHVYVSRKAEVCKDFLQGYCPLGTKCKKKHTLLCPDFARRGVCPRGAQCQLLHRSRKRASRRSPSASVPSDVSLRGRVLVGHGPRKPAAAHCPSRLPPSSPPPRAREVLGSAEVSFAPVDSEVACAQQPASARAAPKLPSFIALGSSPSPVRAQGSPPSKDSGRSLHIKPRL